MGQRTCSIDGCENVFVARGWCRKHYSREHKAGRLQKPTLWQRLNAKTLQVGDCLEWQGYRDKNGYGHINVDGTSSLAHRVAWVLEGLALESHEQLDHACGNPSCVNIGHLRIATHKQNQENLPEAGRGGASGVRGVYWHKANQKWIAQVRHNKKTYYLGQFEHLEDAATAARAKRNELFTYNDRDRSE